MQKSNIYCAFLLFSKIYSNLASAPPLTDQDQTTKSPFVRPEIIARTTCLTKHPVYKKFQSHQNRHHTPDCVTNFLGELRGLKNTEHLLLAFLKTEKKRFICESIYCTCDEGGLHFSILEEQGTTTVPARDIFLLASWQPVKSCCF